MCTRYINYFWYLLGVRETVVVWCEYCSLSFESFYNATGDYNTTTFFINVIVCWEVHFFHYIGEFIAGEGITENLMLCILPSHVLKNLKMNNEPKLP